MTRTSLLCGLVALVLSAGNLSAQEKKAAPPAAAQPAGQDEMMKKWAEYASPGENHKMLEKLVGDWTILNKMWMAPDAPPAETSGKASFHMILGGRYLQQNYTGEVMGMPFEGMGILGYDNFNKYFVSSWTDNVGTGIMSVNGSLGENGDIVFKGGMDDPMTGEKAKAYRQVIHWTGPDTFVMDMYTMMGDKEFKTMEITHTRVK